MVPMKINIKAIFSQKKSHRYRKSINLLFNIQKLYNKNRPVTMSAKTIEGTKE